MNQITEYKQKNWVEFMQNVNPDCDNSALVPADQLPAIINEIEATLAPMGSDNKRAVYWAKFVVGAYPQAAEKMTSPEIYLLGVQSIVGELPEDLAKELVDKITRRSKWLPSRAELHDLAQELAAPRRIALTRAKRLLRSAQQKQKEDQRAALIASERANKEAGAR